MTKTIGGKAKRLKRQARLRKRRKWHRKLDAFFGRIYAGDTPEQARAWVQARVVPD